MSEAILIVDDNPLNLKLMEFLLANHGYDVRTASDAASAVAQLPRFAPSIILLDLQMPDKDGLELSRQLKADPRTRDITIIAVTAFAMAGDEERALAAGCDGYVTKPIDTRALPVLVAKHIANKRKGSA